MLQKIAQAKVKVELQVVNIDTLYNIYKRNYVINKESIWLIDSATNKPLVRETYPKGEYLFKKTDSIIQPLLNEYSSIKDFETKLSKGYYIITFLDKMISLCNTDTKEINKQIKNAKTEDEIKKILGL